MSAGQNGLRTRRQSPGTAFGLLTCAVVTLAVAIVAFIGRPAIPRPVTHSLPDARVLAVPEFDARANTDAAEILDRFYLSGDARYLNYARAALTAEKPQTAADDIVRVRLESAAHRFRSAANLASRLLERDPRNVEARLLRADALRRAGDIDSARRDCLALAMLSDPVIGHWCAVQVLMSEGRALVAHEEALKLAGTGIRTATAIERWSAEVAAEAATLAGQNETAAEIYGQLMASGSAGLAARLAYADLLLADRRPNVVLELLAKDVRLLPAQVRIAIAMKQQGNAPDPELGAAIDTAFAGMSPQDTSDLRLRDRAIFELLYTEDAQAALQFALANWEQQKGPEDLLLLFETATASNDSRALAIVAQWMSRFDSEARS